MPKVSVIMGVYNGSKKIETAIKSILNQTFFDFELIICDDGSTDNSIELIENLAAEDKRIKLLKNSRNLGLAPTLNSCLNEARGEYIARMDDDDISHPGRFEKQVTFLNNNLDYAIVGTSRNLYDQNGVWGRSIKEGERTTLDIYLGRTFTHPSVMMRRKAVLDVEGYTTGTETERTEDFDLWCKLYEKGYKGFNLSDVLFDYFEARDSYNKRKYKYRLCEYRLKKQWRKKLNIPIKYAIHAYRPIFVGLLPTKILMKYHEKKFKE
ncbi:glycosyltransferase family 2 protein [Peribacillus simplex]|uniref:Glycosyltransferase family 2 protein n=2 Tax=Peribacillus TaxID=2675229 RepID=A0AA90P0L4_9BACI|nr:MULTISPECIES: glycosyltransferase family 2 protein [Peribacillus]MDP1417451.1 glycosyltransferase family 2 protein [Peribacillus simplex]MDP1450106.1 glycosyltransferase family 2 protein [Peribacillus frigoritolerans]